MEDSDRRKIMKNMATLLDTVVLNASLLEQLSRRQLLTPAAVDHLRATAGDRDRCRWLLMECTRRGPTAFRQLTLALLETGQLAAARLLQPDISLRDLAETAALPPEAATGAGGEVAAPVSVAGVVPIARASGAAAPQQDPFRGRTASSATSLAPLKSHHQQQHTPSVPTADRADGVQEEEEDGDQEVGVLQLKVRPATEYRGAPLHTDAYRMMSTPRGLALIINNVMFRDEELHQHRVGSEVDERNLVSVLRQLGYEVCTKRDLDRRGMATAVAEFCSDERLANVDSCVMAVLTHGGHQVLYGVDSRPLEVEEVVRHFSHDNCPNLIGKPKWLIFQACRGSDSNLVTRRRVVTADTQATDGQPMSPPGGASLGEQSDIFITYSTIPGYVSIRDRDLGTWLVQVLCEVIAELACSRDLQDLHTIAQDRMTYIISSHNEKQTMETAQRGFRRKLFFNPGL